MTCLLKKYNMWWWNFESRIFLFFTGIWRHLVLFNFSYVHSWFIVCHCLHSFSWKSAGNLLLHYAYSNWFPKPIVLVIRLSCVHKDRYTKRCCHMWKESHTPHQSRLVYGYAVCIVPHEYRPLVCGLQFLYMCDEQFYETPWGLCMRSNSRKITPKCFK